MSRSALKNALLEIISCMLSQNPEVRRIAEERNKALEVTEEYGLHLLDIILTTDEALEERQMAAILLKQYVESYWTDENGTRLPIIAVHVRDKIKSILPTGLSNGSGKIRNHVAYILACIASDDFPNEWPVMCDAIFSREIGSVESSLGIIEFIINFGGMTTIDQIDYCYEKLYSVLYKICSDLEKYSPTIRAEAVNCAAFMISSHIGMKKREDRDINTVERFCEMFANQLILPHPEQSNYDLKSRILRGYTLLLSQMHETVVHIILKFLPSVWQILSRCGEMYDQVLAEDITPDRDPSEDADEKPKFYILAFDIFEVLFTLLDTHCCRDPIATVLPDLLYHMILFMGISKETELLWKSSPEHYLVDELNEEYHQCAVRLRARDLLVLITSQISDTVVLPSLTTAVNKHIQYSKLKTESYYWRIMESVMFAIGSIDSYVTSHYNNNNLYGFEISHYLTQWGEEIGPCPAWLLLARIMWVGGKYSLVLGENSISMYIMTTIHNLREASFILRYSAIRAIALHLSTMYQSKYHHTFMEIRLPIAHALIYAVENSDGDILTIGLRALAELLKVEPPFIEAIHNEVINLIHDLFLRNSTYLEVDNDLQPIVNRISGSNSCWKNFESRFLPVIIDTISNTGATSNTVPPNYDQLTCSIKLLCTVVKHSPQPLNEDLIRCGFFGVCNCMMTINDSGVTQVGAECLRSYLCKGSTQITTSRDEEGRTGAECIVNILKYIIDPQKMEYACRQIGRLCITAIHTLDTILDDHIDFLLRSVLSAMQRANQTPIEEGLLVIFAYLFYNHLESVLNYLTLIPGPHGESALQFVLNKWLRKNIAFRGQYQRNLSTLALARLIEHTIIKHDERVIEVKVTNQPAPLKILYYLIQMLAKEMGYGRQLRDEYAPDTRCDTDETLDVNDDVSRRRLFPDDASDYDETEWNDSCDPLDVLDPIYNLTLREFLTNFFKNISSNAQFCKWFEYLDETDKIILCKIGVVIAP